MSANFMQTKLTFSLKAALFSLFIAVSGVSMASEPAAKATKPDAAAGENLYANGDAARGITACAGCHGAAGNSGSGAWPKLAGQQAGYLVKQLQDFKSGARPNPVMTGMVASLETKDMQDIAAYLTKQVQKGATAKNKETIELGQAIYRGGIAAKSVPACAACHGPSGAGIPIQYPRIGGQWSDYTEAQLTAFRSGARKNLQMSMISARLSDVEIKAVSDYIAGLR